MHRFALFSLLIATTALAAERTLILPQTRPARPVPDAVMKQIYDEVKTPHKHGIILRGEDKALVDCASIFRHQGKWYMVYISKSVGYETYLAESDDLVNWKKLGKILSFTRKGWDAWQAGGGLALQDFTWGGSYELQTFDNKYWLSYIGGALQGYEPDPLSIGMAWTRNPAQAAEWNRLPENPILAPSQPDARDFEKLTLYKSNIIHDKSLSLGHPFIMFYNAKRNSGYERIGIAVSDNMVHWRRYGQQPVIDNGKGISGDPQITKIGDVWVMFYFGAFFKPKAFDTFACSYDLVNWTKWTGPHLVEPSEPWDNTYAHKQWVIKHDGIVYHFYCAVGNQGRVLALATSRPLPKKPE